MFARQDFIALILPFDLFTPFASFLRLQCSNLSIKKFPFGQIFFCHQMPFSHQIAFSKSPVKAFPVTKVAANDKLAIPLQ